MTDVLDKFGDWIKEGFIIYKDNLGVLILSSLIAVLLMVVTVGILSGPMLAGLIMIVLRLRDGKQPPRWRGMSFRGPVFSSQFSLLPGVGRTPYSGLCDSGVCSLHWAFFKCLPLHSRQHISDVRAFPDRGSKDGFLVGLNGQHREGYTRLPSFSGVGSCGRDYRSDRCRGLRYRRHCHHAH